MPLIPEKDQQTVRDLFAQRLRDEVTITYYTQRESTLLVPSQECSYCKETREVLEEVCALAPDKLHLVVKDFVGNAEEARQQGITRIPAFTMSSAGTKGTVRYFGIPAGYEFSTLIEDLIDVSTGQPQLSQASMQALGALDEDLHVLVFVTPT